MTPADKIVPICLGCGKIKCEGDDWEHSEDDSPHGDLVFSHGYCPECYSEALAEWKLGC